MCGSMVAIQSAAAEIRRGIKKIEDKNNRAKIQWSALLHRGTIIIQHHKTRELGNDNFIVYKVKC